jgi:hypothetical protein
MLCAIASMHIDPVHCITRDLQRAMLPGVSTGLVEVVQGDVQQFASLPAALGDANAIVCATGAREFLDPLSPFNVRGDVTGSVHECMFMMCSCVPYTGAYSQFSLPGSAAAAGRVPLMHACVCVGCTSRCKLTCSQVDYQGTANLVALARQRGLRKFVLCSSIGADQLVNPLNLFWGVLFWKKVWRVCSTTLRTLSTHMHGTC